MTWESNLLCIYNSLFREDIQPVGVILHYLAYSNSNSIPYPLVNVIFKKRKSQSGWEALDRVMNLRMRLITREKEHAVGTTTTPAPRKRRRGSGETHLIVLSPFPRPQDKSVFVPGPITTRSAQWIALMLFFHGAVARHPPPLKWFSLSLSGSCLLHLPPQK